VRRDQCQGRRPITEVDASRFEIDEYLLGLGGECQSYSPRVTRSLQRWVALRRAGWRCAAEVTPHTHLVDGLAEREVVVGTVVFEPRWWRFAVSPANHSAGRCGELRERAHKAS
jgi:hypothetical protein